MGVLDTIAIELQDGAPIVSGRGGRGRGRGGGGRGG